MMRKMSFCQAIPVILGLMFCSFTMNNPDNAKVLGSWKVRVPDAPPEYSNSNMVVAEVWGELKVKMIFGESYTVEASGVSFDGETLKFMAGVQGNQIPISGKIAGNTINGTATSPDGELTLTAERITLPGTWSYKAPDAPVEYSAGKLVFTQNEGKPEAKIVFPNGVEVPAADLKATDTSFSFKMKLESETITVSGEIADGKLTGKSATSQGDMSFTATREND
jgi:hypothetical protein